MGTTAIKAIKNEVALVQIANLYDDDIDGLNAGFTISETPAVDGRGRRHFMLAPLAVVAHGDRTQRVPRALVMLNAAARSCIAKADAA